MQCTALSAVLPRGRWQAVPAYSFPSSPFIHDIGKNIVKTLLSSHGFKVVDIGRDVAPSKCLEAAEREKADIVAMSTLMTTTRPATRSTINLFAEAGALAAYKMIIGGGCIDQTWANEIGADGYAADAAGAVDLCKKLCRKVS